jgi:heterodisulfide reductase subunit D
MGIFSLFDKSNTVYFPGCTTYFKLQENFELYQKIFTKLGISFRVIDKKICCGIEALESGYESEARKLARRNFEIFKEENIDSIITTSPECFKMFSQDYPDFLPDWNIETKNIWQLILNRLKNKPKLIKNKAMEVITYHDPCYLGRYSKIYEQPREILELIGYEIKEMPDSREESICCGSCGGLPRTNPNLANEIAKQRILQAKRIGVTKIITTSPENYELLRKNTTKDIEILELSEVLAIALGLKINKQINEPIEGEEQIILETKTNIAIEEELKEEDYYDESKY